MSVKPPRGFTRRDLFDAYRQVKSEEQERRAPANEVRKLAWYLYNVHRPYAWQWWSIGFSRRFGAKVERHDFTVIPGYDTLAQEVASYFPQFADDDGTERLWALLLSPYVTMPSKTTMLREAQRRLREFKRSRGVAFDYGVPQEF